MRLNTNPSGLILIFASAVALACSILIILQLQPSATLNEYKQYCISQEEIPSDSNSIKVTFFGVSTLLVDDGETQLLIDGFFSRPNAFKVGFGKISSDAQVVRHYIKHHQIDRLKGIFVAHTHYDHALDASEVTKQTRSKLFGSASMMNIGRGANLSDSLMQQFDPTKKLEFGEFMVKVVPSKHSPPINILGMSNATDPNHPNIDKALKQPASARDFIEGGSYDFYITHPKGKFYIKPSANYITNAMKDYPADVIFLGVGTLGKQSAAFQENYFRETVVATGAKTVIPLHWDNFTVPLNQPLQPSPLLGDNVATAFDFLIRKCEKDGRIFRLLQAKQSIIIQ